MQSHAVYKVSQQPILRIYYKYIYKWWKSRNHSILWHSDSNVISGMSLNFLKLGKNVKWHVCAVVQVNAFNGKQSLVFLWISDFFLSLTSYRSPANSKFIFLLQLQWPQPATTRGPLRTVHATATAGSQATPFPFSVTPGTRSRACLKSHAFSSTTAFTGSQTPPPALVRSDFTSCTLFYWLY